MSPPSRGPQQFWQVETFEESEVLRGRLAMLIAARITQADDSLTILAAAHRPIQMEYLVATSDKESMPALSCD